MSDIAIRVENLGKRYRIGHAQKRHDTLRDQISDWGKRLFKSEILNPKSEMDFIWALRDISFEVKRGEVVGIIGRNGAGKSTLLKILARITKPTEGYADIYGRVGSLLEVGTGFHHELTGRENIYLSGAILGMRKAEIDHKFDEIVAFAEVEKFVDTPVKHFSSGMYVRLAFAVAAHLEPEILLVDEVLAVGDAAFQKKCLGKMGDVAKEGRTVLFVSHNMAAITNLCQVAYRFDEGQLKSFGDPVKITAEYFDAGESRRTCDLTTHQGRKRSSRVLMQRVSLLTNDPSSSTFQTGKRFGFEVDCQVDKAELPVLSLGFIIRSSLGMNLCSSNMSQYNSVVPNINGSARIRVDTDELPLTPGRYSISLYLGNGAYDLDNIEEAIYFDVLWNPIDGIAYPPRREWGALFMPVRWNIS
jgi:lipopolysaccharide transport system ATP-binding protein